MAAIMDSYQPEGLTFSQHYPASVPDSSYGRENRFDPDDDVVKSKPSRGGSVGSSYVPLVNDNPHRKDWRERQQASSEGTALSSHMRPSTANPNNQVPQISIKSSSSTTNEKVPPQSSAKALNPAATDVHQLASNGNDGISGTSDLEVLGTETNEEEVLIKVDLLSAEEQPSDLLRESTPRTESENEQDQESVLGGSTTALLGEYQEVGGNRKASQSSAMSLGLPGDVLCSSGGLVEVLVVGHKKCSVSLAEESINWQILSRKSGEGRGLCIYLCEYICLCASMHVCKCVCVCVCIVQFL